MPIEPSSPNDTATELTWRREQVIRRDTAVRLAVAFLEWAHGESDLRPDHDQIAAEVRAEVEILCRGLDDLAAVDPDLVFFERFQIWDDGE